VLTSTATAEQAPVAIAARPSHDTRSRCLYDSFRAICVLSAEALSGRSFVVSQRASAHFGNEPVNIAQPSVDLHASSHVRKDVPGLSR
jgi:hypothetical protein